MPQESSFQLRRLCPCTVARRRRLRVEFATAAAAATQRKAGCPKYPASDAPAAERRRLEHSNAGVAPRAALSAQLLLGAATLALSASTPTLAQPFLQLALVGAFATLLPSASAHNWIINPTSRATQASTTKPCRPRMSNIPDVHVNPAQEWEVEWAPGHGRAKSKFGTSVEGRKSASFFFTVVRAEDADKLVLIDTDVVNDYVDSAPAGAEWLPKLHWDKRHLSWTGKEEGAVRGNAGKGGCADSVHVGEGLLRSYASDDPHYIERAQAFKCYKMGRHKGSPDLGDGCYSVAGGLSQWRFSPEALSVDKRVACVSAHVPFSHSFVFIIFFSHNCARRALLCSAHFLVTQRDDFSPRLCPVASHTPLLLRLSQMET